MNDLAIMEERALVPAEVFKPGGVNDLLQRIAERARAARRDVSTPQGRAEIASLAYKIARSKTTMDEMGKELVSEWKTRSAQVDAERRRVREFLDSLKDEIREPLTRFEAAEKARIEGHEAALAAIAAPHGYGATETAAEIGERLAQTRAYPPRDWQEFTQRFEEAQAAEIDRLERLHSAALEREQRAAEEAQRQAAEAEARRQEEERARAEREARIAAAAAEQARRDAEERAEAQRQAAERAQRDAEERAMRAEQARRDAEERAERERQEAEARAERERASAVEAERRRAQAERDAEEEEARRRAANKAHKAAVNRAVLDAFVLRGVAEGVAKVVIESIVRGEVPHVSITY